MENCVKYECYGRPLVMLWTLNTFRKRVKDVVTSKGIQVGIEWK
jgi:hypothetical protein